MEQLTGLDAGFLALESATSVAHIAGVLVLDPSTSPEPWTFDRLTRHMAARLERIPVTTRKLASVPFGLDRPYWVADRSFDIGYHLRHISLPQGAGRDGLAEQVARIHARPLDRSRPLWETYLIEGLPDGRVAVMTKIHHAAIDGISGQEILAALVDLEPDVPVPDEVEPVVAGGDVDQRIVLGRAAVRLGTTPLRMARAGVGLARSVPGMRRSAPTGAVAPRTPFNASCGPHRRWAYSSVPLADVKAVKDRAGASVNDVVLTMIGGVLRRWLEGNGGVPEKPLVAMVPLSVRPPDHDGSVGNFITGSVCTLATHLADPLHRLAEVREGMRLVKEQEGAIPASVLTDLTQVAPPAVAALAARLVVSMRLGPRVPLPFNLVVSNVPGPPIPLYLAGARIESHYPLSVVGEGNGLNVTVMSTNGMLDFGFVSDRDLVPDLWDMADTVRPVLDELLAATDPA